MFKSLSARLFAILTVGLGAIQIVSFFAFMVFRGGEIKEEMTRFLGADVSFAYDLMRSIPSAQEPDYRRGPAGSRRSRRANRRRR